MKPNMPLEDRLRLLGESLRAQPRLDGTVMDQLRAKIADGSLEMPVSPARANRGLRRKLLAVVGTVVTIGACLVAGLVLFPSKSLGWEQVTRALQSQSWIHGTATMPDGGKGVMWLSPKGQKWGYQLDGSVYFFDATEKAKYEFPENATQITKLPLGSDGAQRVLPLDALADESSSIGSWLFGTEKILQQKRVEVSEGGKTWIEFQLELWRGDLNRATLRVDPETNLPVHMTLTSPTNSTRPITWRFDYPAEGPEDIYALGVPRDTQILDRMPGDSTQQLLDAMTASRNKIGDFRLVLGEFPGATSVVHHKGNRWRVDSYLPLGQGAQEVPDGKSWPDVFNERLEKSHHCVRYVCDGNTVWENSNPSGPDPLWVASKSASPDDLLTGSQLGFLYFASLVYPDLTPKPHWTFEVVSDPDGWPGCVLVKRSAEVASVEPSVGHEWYYVDPAKGYAVVRADLFMLPPDAPVDPKTSPVRQTVSMEDFRQSPQGYWYPAVIRQVLPVVSVNGVQAGSMKSVAHYHFDFDVEMPDSLFTKEAEAPSIKRP